MTNSQITALKAAMVAAHHIVFLTGAGVSTHSGIPDYRSKSGIYNGISEPPETILSPDTLNHRPQFFYDFVMHNMYFPEAQPNLIHRKIATWCRAKGTLITQNIDILDTKSANPHVIEFHGNLYRLYCSKCHQKVSFKTYQQGWRHESCGGILRPGIVLYNEGIDSTVLEQSAAAMQQSDLVIICGTSFVVYPFAQLLAYRQPGASVWAINKTAIAATGVHSLIGDALDVFKEL
ncbi:MAG: NAD-dependent protein deacylase [Lactobacillus sp.]